MSQPKIVANQLDLGTSTSAIKIPSGTTSERPISPSNGEIRYNSTLSGFEGYAGGSWAALTAGALTATLDDLTDVIISAPVINQILTFDGTNWINSTASSPVAHNTLTGLQGGSAGQYFHLSSAQNTTVSALNALGNGLFAKTASGVYSTRTLTAPISGITVTNGDGIAGNPTLALSDDLSSLEGLSTNGIATRTASNTWVTRVIAGTTNQLLVSDGDGIAGNPTISLSTDMVLPGNASVTLPIGTTAQRGTAANGQIRYNTTTGLFEGYQSGTWVNLSPTVFDISGHTSWLNGSIVEGTTIFSYVANDQFTLPIGLANSHFYLADASGNTGSKTFTIYHYTGSLTQVGTISYTAPYVTPTITFTSAVTFAIGDALIINGTTSGEGTLIGSFTFNLKATY